MSLTIGEIKWIRVRSVLECIHKCYSEPECWSVNVEISAAASKRVCTLMRENNNLSAYLQTNSTFDWYNVVRFNV